MHAHMRDAVDVIAYTIRDMVRKKDNMTEAPKNCSDQASAWTDGIKLLK